MKKIDQLCRKSRSVSPSVSFDNSHNNLNDKTKRENIFYTVPINEMVKDLFSQFDDYIKYSNYTLYEAVFKVVKSNYSEEEYEKQMVQFLTHLEGINKPEMDLAESYIKQILDLDKIKQEMLDDVVIKEKDASKDLNKQIESRIDELVGKIKENVSLKAELALLEEIDAMNARNIGKVKEFSKNNDSKDKKLNEMFKEIDELEKKYSKLNLN